MNRPVLLALSLSATMLTGCAAGQETVADDPVVRPPSTAAAPSIAPSAAPSSLPSPSPSPDGARVIDVVVAGGEVTGVESRVAARLGEDLLVRVTSDAADEVHVHGYDLYGDVAAGGTVEIPVTASIPGGFEVELERSGLLLFQLRVA